MPQFADRKNAEVTKAPTISAGGVLRSVLSKPRAAEEGGFSLLEIMIVIVVMALAMAIAYPSLSRGTAALHLRSAGRYILNTMRYAREKAITEQSELRIVAEREARKLTLTDAYGEGGRTYLLPHDITIDRMTLAGEEIVDGPLVVRFLPNGSAESAEIVLKSDKGGILRIVTDPITGGARILNGTEGGSR